jgi:CDGSH-type Zn-finger protein
MSDNQENTGKVPEVRVLPKGPIMLKGNFSFRDSSGKITTGEQELYLCRCGGSKNKPWCDGTHKSIGVPG